MNLKFSKGCSVLFFSMLSAAITLVTADALAASENLDFEPPSYSVGSVLGQNGWFWNGYSVAQDGVFTVSDDSPLGGIQSLRFERSSQALSDISLANVIAAKRGAGTDLQVSYLYSAGANSLGGLFVGPDGVNGWSPAFVQFLPDGTVLYGENFGVFSFVGLTYAADDLISVKYEMDFTDDPSGIGVVTYRFNNLTSGAPEYVATKNFFAGWGPEGPNGEYLVDVSVVGRLGIGRIDDIQLSAIPEPGTLTGLITTVVAAMGLNRRRK